MEYDLIISGGTVIDGSGSEGYAADLAIKNGRIARIGDLKGASAARVALSRSTSCATVA